jgi:tetratricopeptide (TPR) repeat protein
MSYINDALRKAQSEKDGRYGNYSETVFASAPGRPADRGKWMAVVISIAVLTTAAGLGWYAWNGQKAAPAPKPTVAPTATLPAPSPAAPVASAGTPAADAASLYRTALDLQKQGQLAEAERSYNRILERNPLHCGALNNLGVLYMNQGKTAEAVRMFERAAALKVNADPYYNLACIHTRMNNLSLGLHYLKIAAGMDPRAKEWAEKDKDLDALKALPGFKKIIE